MIELFGLVGVALVQLTAVVFGYYSAVGHVNRMLEIDEPDSPQILRIVSDEALTAADIDAIDDWDDTHREE